MEIRRTVALPEWNESTPQKIKQYWQGRGVVLQQVDDRRMRGRRGSLWGNLCSLHIAKVVTTVEVTRTPTGLECVLNIDPRYRSVTVLNRTYLELELAVFESFLLTGDLQPQAWAEHRQAAARASVELAGMALRHVYLRRGPMVIGGDLRFKAWIMLFFAGVLPPITLLLGSKLKLGLDTLFSRPTYHFPVSGILNFLGPILAIAYGAIFSTFAVWLLKLRRDSAACVSVEQAADRLGVEAERMRHTILDRNISPRFVRDGEPVYAIDDLTGATQLLRPAASPGVEGLLRPAAASQANSAEHLLRPTASDEAVDQAGQVQGMIRH
jgi:hypothetical protein